MVTWAATTPSLWINDQLKKAAKNGKSKETPSRGALARVFAALGTTRKASTSDEAEEESYFASESTKGPLQRGEEEGHGGSPVPENEGPEGQEDQLDLGLRKGMEEDFELTGDYLGRGAYGTVLVAKPVGASGPEYACKKISKGKVSGETDDQWARRLDMIKTEVEALTRLRGSLSAVRLEGAYEDDDHAYIIMEQIRGEPVRFEMGRKLYNEQEVSHIMRSAARTVAQLHARGFLHRDIKPSNFMFVRADKMSPIKSIDFGLAARYEPGFPRNDVALQGTPHYLAPEVLSGRVGPEADVWALGVMAYQLLAGKMPFTDKRNPSNPSMAAVFKDILSKNVDDLVDGKHAHRLEGVSQDAKNFIKAALTKDPEKRPSARELLRMPFVARASAASDSMSEPGEMVRRLQRFAAMGPFKKEVLALAVRSLARGQADAGEEISAAVEEAEGVHAELCCLSGHDDAGLKPKAMAKALWAKGCKVTEGEARRLAQGLDVDADGEVSAEELAAAVIDWRSVDKGGFEALVASVYHQLVGQGVCLMTKEKVAEVLRPHMRAGDEEAAAEQEVFGAKAISFDALCAALQRQESLGAFDGRDPEGSLHSIVADHSGSARGRSFSGRSQRGPSTTSRSSSHGASFSPCKASFLDPL